MTITRRVFLERGGMMAMALATRQGVAQVPTHAVQPKFRTQLNASTLAQFVDPLPLPEVLLPAGKRPSPDNPALQLPYYRVAMREFESRVHRDLKPTRLWGYASSMPGPTIETRSGQGLLVEWANELPEKHFLPVDHSIHGAEADKPEVRTVVHLHGAKASPESDGYPENWYAPGKSTISHYPNRQDAAMLWYHDHALGINRLNVFAGLFGAFFVRDEFEDGLNLPRGKYEIPLMICDRIFDPGGQLNYPVSDDPKSPWVPEVFGDAVLLNGKLFPYLEVEPRKYRFRVLNASNARFFRMTLSNGQSFHQIGTDQGLLPAPVPLTRLTIAPGERADLIIDFSEHDSPSSAEANIILKNDNFLNLMQFRVAQKGAHDDRVLPQTLRSVPKIPESSAVKTRVLTLGQTVDKMGRTVSMLLNNTHWSMPVTENPILDSTEIWSLVNLTDDSHPIHLHMVKFQILDRRPIITSIHWNAGEFRYTGPAVAPGPSEAGWKDTVRADPGMVTRIIVPFVGFTGRYVWHCHILEHEDNEMMRPFDVVAK